MARVGGKTVFVDNALPGELVVLRYTKRHGRFDEAVAAEIREASLDRIEARCPHFGICGGCSLQHLAPEVQVAHKQRMLLDQLEHVGKVRPEQLLWPITGPVWGYRRRARLGVRFVPKKGGALVGFREKASNRIADLRRCEVLHPAAGDLLLPLRELINGLSIPDRIPQIEVTADDERLCLTFRHLAPFEESDLHRLREFAAGRNVVMFLQAGGVDSVVPLWPEHPAPLAYRLPAHQASIQFKPLDFVQVNAEINRAAVNKVIELIEPQAGDAVIEFFCGLGNFTLAVARHAGRVVGLEGDRGLVERARENAARNGITHAEFVQADLTVAEPPAGTFNKVLLDPPRTGALEIVQKLDLSHTERVVYVSCNPATLARDAGVLVHEKGLRLAAAGVMDMFPHTAHVESIALFLWNK